MTKKLLTVMLALICVMLFAVPAMAAEDYPISNDGQHDFTSTSTEKYITVENGAKPTIKLDGANLSTLTVNSGAEVTLVLVGSNKLTGDPAVIVDDSATLIISSERTGSLECGAIKGGNIVIEGGTVIATSDTQDVAGIGGKNITISGGIVTAYGGNHAPAIGAVDGHPVDNIIISGGTVTATATGNGAGIGAGRNAHVDTLVISGGTVIAKGGTRGSGIGLAPNATMNTLAITGGTVEATSGRPSVGNDIGNYSDQKVGVIEITGGNITAKTAGGIGEHVKEHDIKYISSTATITAKCSRCGDLGSVTISAPAVADLTYDGSSKDASLSYADWTLAEADKPTTITYNDVNRINVTGNAIEASVDFGDKTATVSYKITKAPITSVEIGDVAEPAAEAKPQKTVEVKVDGVTSTVDIVWNPPDNPFKYDTEYTGKIELTAGSNYEFTNQTSVNGQEDGWWKPSIDGNTLTLTHTKKTGEQQAPAPIPTIEAASPTNVTVYVGEKVTFKVKAENADLKWFKWSENDTPIETGKTGDTFEIDSVSLENDGDRYVCVAFGEEQAVQGPTFTLHVLNLGAPGAPAPTPAPQTGDASNIGLWLALSCISLAGMVAIVMQGKKKRI